MNNYALRPPEMANFQFHHHFEVPEGHMSPQQQQGMFLRPTTAQQQGLPEDPDLLGPLPGYELPYSEYNDTRPPFEPFQPHQAAMPAPLFSLGFPTDLADRFPEKPVLERPPERDPRLQQDYLPEEGPDLRLLMTGLFPSQDSPIGGPIPPPPMPHSADFPPMPMSQPLFPQPVAPPHPPPQHLVMGHPPAAEPLQKPARKRNSRSRQKRPLQGSKSSSRDSQATLLSMDLLDLLSLATSVDSSASPKKMLESPGFGGISPTLPQAPHFYTPHPDHCPIVRGVATGGCTAHPPPEKLLDRHHVQVKLEVGGTLIEQVCHSPWSQGEALDRRRIVRIERRQQGHRIYADFSIIGCANDHPKTEPPPPDADVIEVSCLAWDKASDENNPGPNFYITSVEVVAIVETLIQSKLMELKLRRRERGRIRLNLLTFWLKPLYHLKTKVCPEGHKAEFARLIMSYGVRKPRGFDKGFRILSWDRLVPALNRALQCYYAEMTTQQRDKFVGDDDENEDDEEDV